MAEETSKTSGIEIDREEQRRALARVYSLLLQLAAQHEAAGEGDLSEVSEPTATAEKSDLQPDGLEE